MDDWNIKAVGEDGITAYPGTIIIRPNPDIDGKITITKDGIIVSNDKGLARAFGLWIVAILDRNKRKWLRFAIDDEKILEIDNYEIVSYKETDDITKEFLAATNCALRLSVLK